MWQRSASGTRYEIGVQVGRLMREQNYARFTGQDIPFLKQPGKLAFTLACKEAVQTHAPELIEELEGILDGGGFDFETLGVLELSLSARPGCTLFAIGGEHTADGAPILARSYDFMDWSIPDFTGTWVRPEGGLASLGFTDMGLGRYGGTNEAGLAIATTGVSFDDTAPGVINPLATRRILDTCRTVGEAVSFLRAIPQVWGVNYLLIDGDGAIAIVEAHPERTQVIYPDGGFAVAANHYVAPEMQAYQARVHPNSAMRRDYVRAWFGHRDGPITVDAIKTVQRDHEHEMCAHAAHGGVGFCTCWAWIAQATEGRIDVCQGSPCQNEYRVLSLLAE
jgi:predicted choloylglycine hydrolase